MRAGLLRGVHACTFRAYARRPQPPACPACGSWLPCADPATPPSRHRGCAGTGTAPESHWNTALYGADADLVALLEGRGAGAETFEALAPLYRTINSMAAKARQ